MSTPKAAKGWVVVTPRGRVLLPTIAYTQKDAILNYCEWHGWPDERDTGYRCLPCTITVSEDERETKK